MFVTDWLKVAAKTNFRWWPRCIERNLSGRCWHSCSWLGQHCWFLWCPCFQYRPLVVSFSFANLQKILVYELAVFHHLLWCFGIFMWIDANWNGNWSHFNETMRILVSELPNILGGHICNVFFTFFILMRSFKLSNKDSLPLGMFTNLVFWCVDILNCCFY